MRLNYLVECLLMHIGLKVPNWGQLAGPDALARTAVAADERGFDSVWVSDHIAFPAGADTSAQPLDASSPFLDPLAALTFAAALTRHVQLSTGVYVLPLRNPIVVAKHAASVDVLSGGRLLLGIGVGWLKAEFDLLGASWRDRGHRTDDAVETMRACWAQPEDSEIAMWPRPVGQMPVIVGGHTGAALDRAVRLGDGWYGSGLSTAEFADIADRLNASVQADRPGERLLVGTRATDVMPDDAARVVADFRYAGADFIVLDAAHTTVDGAVDWIHRTADALKLDGSHTPLVSGRSWH
jgi:probable F420-dependent oxidoreductase